MISSDIFEWSKLQVLVHKGTQLKKGQKKVNEMQRKRKKVEGEGKRSKLIQTSQK